MSSKLNNFLENFLNTFIVTLIISGLPGLYSFIISIYTEKSFINTLTGIPISIYIVFTLPLIIYLLYYLVNKYIKGKMNEGVVYCFTITKPVYDYEIIESIVVNGLLWCIKQDKMSILRNDLDNFEIDPEPRCPECKIKMYYKRCHWWYKWSCINNECNYTVRTWNHQDKIENIVRKKVEYSLEKNKKK